MSVVAAQGNLIDQARQHYADHLARDVDALLKSVIDGAHELADQPAERALAQLRFDMVQELRTKGAGWPQQVAEYIQRQHSPQDAPDSLASALISSLQGQKDLTLVDDATVRLEIAVSRLSLAVMDLSSWELSDLRARAMKACGLTDFADDDLFRPQVLSRCFVKAWMSAGLTVDAWQQLESVLHKQLARRCQECLHETNRWLVDKGVMPEVDLRPFIRRSDGTPTQAGGLDGAAASTSESPPPAAPSEPPVAPAAVPAQGVFAAPAAWRRLFITPSGGEEAVSPSPAGAAATSGPAVAPGGVAPAGSDWGGGMASPSAGPVGGLGQIGAVTGHSAWVGGQTTGYRRGYDDETRMLTRPAGSAPVRPDVVLEQFGQMVERHLPGFLDTQQGPRAPSEQLSQAMARAQQHVVDQVAGDVGVVTAGGTPIAATPERVLRDLRERQRELKQAAASPAERATIELVALLFQSILTDDRIPATIRVWFARLQMPVLRVAIAEPDFFSSEDHPARRLIDRMGACVMGFEGAGTTEAVGPALETEIKRIVQVVEAFPDTGRRVFQTVLNEFEKFLEGYYADHDATTRMGISLAQQVEQRETLAIQYTIELRKLLADVPVQDGVREFLFHIWADVLATMAIRHGGQSPEVKTVRDAATELMWSATAKTTREERAEVIRRLPPLLATLRHGMNAVGMAGPRQEDAIKALNLALTAAFGARAVTVTNEQFEQLKQRLETIEEMIPDDDFEIDDTWVLDESSHSNEGLEVVAEGGSLPGPAMIEWAMALRLGDAFTLEYRGRHETVRLVWQGMHKQLSLFGAGGGRCVLFQKARLAAFLQAGLLLPIQDEALTVSATREAMRKLEVDPGRILH